MGLFGMTDEEELEFIEAAIEYVRSGDFKRSLGEIPKDGSSWVPKKTAANFDQEFELPMPKKDDDAL